MCPSRAGVTQLAECLLPKQNVAGSNPVSRSNPLPMTGIDVMATMGSMRLWILAVLILTVAACGGSETTPPADSLTVKPAPTESVEWRDYGPDVQAEIDALAEAKDCVALQEQIDVAVATWNATINRTGHSNAKLIAYLDAAMRDAGCYF